MKTFETSNILYEYRYSCNKLRSDSLSQIHSMNSFRSSIKKGNEKCYRTVAKVKIVALILLMIFFMIISYLL